MYSAIGKALKGRNSKAMGLDPLTKPSMGLQALKGRNSAIYIDPISDNTSCGLYFAPSGLRSAGRRPAMGQDPSLCYFAPLGLFIRNIRPLDICQCAVRRC